MKCYCCEKEITKPSAGECIGGIAIYWCEECMPPTTRQKIEDQFSGWIDPPKELKDDNRN